MLVLLIGLGLISMAAIHGPWRCLGLLASVLIRCCMLITLSVLKVGKRLKNAVIGDAVDVKVRWKAVRVLGIAARDQPLLEVEVCQGDSLCLLCVQSLEIGAIRMILNPRMEGSDSSAVLGVSVEGVEVCMSMTSRDGGNESAADFDLSLKSLELALFSKSLLVSPYALLRQTDKLLKIHSLINTVKANQLACTLKHAHGTKALLSLNSLTAQTSQTHVLASLQSLTCDVRDYEEEALSAALPSAQLTFAPSPNPSLKVCSNAQPAALSIAAHAHHLATVAATLQKYSLPVKLKQKTKPVSNKEPKPFPLHEVTANVAIQTCLVFKDSESSSLSSFNVATAADLHYNINGLQTTHSTSSHSSPQVMRTVVSETKISLQNDQSITSFFRLDEAIITLTPDTNNTAPFKAQMALHPIKINVQTYALLTIFQNIHHYIQTNKLSFPNKNKNKETIKHNKSSNNKVTKMTAIDISCASVSLLFHDDYLSKTASHSQTDPSSTMSSHSNYLHYNITSDSISIHVVPPNHTGEGRLLITSSHVDASILFCPHASLPTLSKHDTSSDEGIHDEHDSQQQQQTCHLLTIGVIADNFKFDTDLPVQPKLKDATTDIVDVHRDAPDGNSSSATLSVSVDKLTMYERVENTPPKHDGNDDFHDTINSDQDQDDDEIQTPPNTGSDTTNKHDKTQQKQLNATTLVTSYLTKVIVTKTAKTLDSNKQTNADDNDDTTKQPRVQITQNIHVETNGPSVDVTWSIICHWTFLSAIRKTNEMIRRFKHILQNTKELPTQTTTEMKPKKKPITNVSLRLNQAVINAHIIVGKTSTMDVKTKQFTLDVEDDAEGRWRKPTVHVATGYTTVLFNECECDVVTLHGMEFHNVMRHATQNEIDAYLGQTLKQSSTTKDGAIEELVRDDNGHPLKEIVELKVIDNVTVCLPPSLHLGNVIDDFVVTPRTLFEGMRAAGFMKPKPQLKKKPYHLMTILADVPFVDARLLEHKNDDFFTDSEEEENKENVHHEKKNHDDLYIDRMRARIDSLNLTIDRNTPPETTQSILNDLDEDKTKTHVYGPVIQGGQLHLTIGLAICTLHPATIVSPLALLRDCTIDSLFLLAPLSPETEGLTEGRTIDVPLKSQHEHSSYNQTYGMSLKTSGIPPKVFFGKGTKLTALSIEGAYGMLLMGSIPKLMEIIRRLTPPPPPPPPSLSSLKPPPPLPWFDNLRFWIHGEMSLMAESLSFRWLLDNEFRYDLSILLTCHHFSFDHSVGNIGLGMDDVIVSIPGSSYDLFLEREVSNESWGLLHEMCDFKNEDERHSLLLLPHLRLQLDFEWVPPFPDTKCSEHHCAYMVHHQHDIEMESVPSKFPDKFERFRSDGVKMNLVTTLGAGADFTNWVALRIDALPWLTHQSSVPFNPPPRDPDMPEPLPRIESMAISVALKELQIGAWFDDPDQWYSDQQDAKLSPVDGLCLILPKVQFFMEEADIKIQADGPIQAALMNICYENSKQASIPSLVPRSDDNEMDNCDRMTGWFGDGIFDSAGVLETIGSNHLEEKIERQSSASSDFFSQNPFLRHTVAENTHDLFKYLQSISQQISELDYLLVVEGIDVLNQALEDLQETLHDAAESFTEPPSGGKPDHEEKENEEQKEQDIFHPSFDSFAQNHEKMQPTMGGKSIDSTNVQSSKESTGEKHEKDHTPDEDKTWTVLVSELKLLWTLEIRDAVVSIVQDILFTIDIMTLQLRAAQPSITNDELQEEETDGDLTESKLPVTNDSQSAAGEVTEIGKEPAMPHLNSESSQKQNRVSMRDISSIAHLLRSKRDLIQSNDDNLHGTQRNSDEDILKTVPTFDVHLANPQVQLHSEATGGSVVLAIHGVYIEGRRFLHLLTDKANPSPEDLLRKTDFQYTIDSAEIYALGEKVDVTAGLQWLERMDTAECTEVEEEENAEELTTEQHENLDSPTSAPMTDMERLFLTDKGDQSLDGKTSDTIPVQNESVVSSSISGVSNISDKYTHFARQKRQFIRHFEHHRPRKFKKPRLLRKILNQSTFHTHHTFLRKPLDLSNEELSEYISSGMVVPVNGNSHGALSGVDTQGQVVLEDLELHIDELSFKLDSYQFRSLIDLFRNVLLEAPRPPRDRTYLLGSLQGTDKSKEAGEKVSTSQKNDEKPLSQSTVRSRKMEDELRRWGSTPKQSRKKKGRNALRSAAQALLLELEKKHLSNRGQLMRRIEYTLGKLKWKVQSPDFVDDVEISFTGFSGQHDFSVDGSVVTQIGLEFFRVFSNKPSPSSINFYDPTAIITAELLGTKRSPCQRCGLEFDMSANESNSCVFHSGIYRMSTSKSGSWSCCGACWEGAPGCVSRPHTGKERAAQVRVESLPSGVDGLTIYKHFEINVFPSERAVLVVQVTKELAKLFMSYFVLDGGDIVNYDEEIPSSSCHGDINDDGSSVITTKSTSSDVDHKKAALLGNKGTTLAEMKGSTASVSVSTIEITDKSINTASDEDGDLIVSSKSSEKRTEIFFLKYWRVGNINVQVSLAAFRAIPDFTALDIVVPDFAKAYKVGTAGYILKKFLSHFISEILKSAASSGLGKFKDKMMRSSNEPVKTGENPYKAEAPEAKDVSDSNSISSRRDISSDKVSILGSVQKIKKKQGFKKLLKKGGK